MAEDFDKMYNDNGIFRYSEDGFTVEIDNEEMNIKWKSITSIIAYKKDLLVYDTICQEVFFEGENGFTIVEETPGWFRFVEQCKRAFAGIDPDWNVKIVNPAFATNYTLVYDRENRVLEEILKSIRER